MINLFRAEWIKIAGNRPVVAGLVWFFPVLSIGIVLLMVLLALFGSPGARAAMGFDSTVGGGIRWDDTMVEAWDIPTNVFGRVLLAAFTAVVFAGEYQWGTLKNVLPRRRRVPVVLTKFAALGAFIVMAYAIMSLLLGAGLALPVWIGGGVYGPEITGGVLADFAHDYAFKAITVFTSTLIAAGYAALAAMLTRSVLAGVLVGIGAVLFEAASLAGLALFALLFSQPQITSLYLLTPGYNLGNVTSWINSGTGMDMGALVNNATPPSLEASILILAAWVAGLVSVTVLLFRRQDVTS